MRNRLKLLFSVLVITAFAGQAVAANACIAALQSQHGAAMDSVEANTDHGALEKAPDHSDPLHDPNCANDCDTPSAFVDGQAPLAAPALDEIAKSKNSAASAIATQLHMPSTAQVRAPPLASDLYLIMPTSLLSQQTLLLI